MDVKEIITYAYLLIIAFLMVAPAIPYFNNTWPFNGVVRINLSAYIGAMMFGFYILYSWARVTHELAKEKGGSS